VADQNGSAAFSAIKDFAMATGSTTRTAASTCGHCGRRRDVACGEKGCEPEPGAFSVCTACGGINRYDDALSLVRVDTAEIEALPPAFRAQVLEMQALVRAIRTRSLPGKRTVQA